MHRLVFFSSSIFGLPSIKAIRTMPDVELVAVVSQAAKTAGRGGQLQATPVSQWAEQYQLPLLTPTSLRTATAVKALKELTADTFVVAAYGLILPPTILQLPSDGSLNIHASLLPAFRGASPIAAALVAGQTTTGISFMLMDEGIDTGPVLAAHALPIEPKETTPELQTRLAGLAAQHLPDLLTNWWAGQVSPQAQTGPSSYAPLLRKADGQANWQSAVMLERKIRAYQPWPGVWTTWRGQLMKILSAEISSDVSPEKPGLIVGRSSSPGWAIACRDGLLIPTTVQLAGKKPQAASSLPGSYPNFIGSQCD